MTIRPKPALRRKCGNESVKGRDIADDPTGSQRKMIPAQRMVTWRSLDDLVNPYPEISDHGIVPPVPAFVRFSLG